MKAPSSGLRSGVLLVLLGGFLILRTVTHDSTGRTLIDRVLGKTSGIPGNATNAQLDTLGQGQGSVIAPNALSGQMAVNNVRLRVQQALRTGKTPAPGDVAFLQANVPGFSLAKLTSHSPLAGGIGLTSRPVMVATGGS